MNKIKNLLMGSYIDNNLINGEEVIYNGKIHWFIYFPAVFSLIIFLLLIFINSNATKIIAILMFVYGISVGFKSFIYSISTEFGITNKRIISKLGVVSRETTELLHSKIESIQVDQSVLGRLLNYGNLKITGTGGSFSTILMIENPIEFKKQAIETLHLNN
jgi:uncharacterized membrane protein YdbT with pleckstrin-like domain